MTQSFEIYGMLSRDVYEWVYKTLYSSKEEAQSVGRKLEKMGKLPVGPILWNVCPSTTPCPELVKRD